MRWLSLTALSSGTITSTATAATTGTLPSALTIAEVVFNGFKPTVWSRRVMVLVVLKSHCRESFCPSPFGSRWEDFCLLTRERIVMGRGYIMDWLREADSELKRRQKQEEARCEVSRLKAEHLKAEADKVGAMVLR